MVLQMLRTYWAARVSNEEANLKGNGNKKVTCTQNQRDTDEMSWTQNEDGEIG